MLRLRISPHIDRRGVEPGADMGGVKLLDHLDRRSTVFCNLIDVRALHEAPAAVAAPVGTIHFLAHVGRYCGVEIGLVR
jgi:hypothetical protein